MSRIHTDTTLTLIASTIAHEVMAILKDSLAKQQGQLQPVLLTVKEAASYLGRSEQSVQHLIFRRELPVVRVGRRVHLHRRDLDEWIEKNKY